MNDFCTILVIMIDICPVGFNYFCNFATKSDAVDITNLLILHNL